MKQKGCCKEYRGSGDAGEALTERPVVGADVQFCNSISPKLIEGALLKMKDIRKGRNVEWTRA